VPTFTQSPTQLPTAAPTFTQSPTSLPTAVPTFTQSPTLPPTAMPTASHSPTPPKTATPTKVPTGITPVVSPSPTSTAVVSAVLNQNVFRPSQGPLQINLKPLKAGHVTVRVFTLSGAKIRTPYQADVPAGGAWIPVLWDGRNESGQAVASGLYLVSVQGGGVQRVLKVALLK